MTHSVLPRRSALIRFGCVAVGVLLLDVVTKVLAVMHLRPGEAVRILGDLLRLYLIRNPGAAFSIGQGATWVFTVLAVGVLIFLFVAVIPGLRQGGWAIGLGLIVAGIAGNLVDRLFRAPGFAQGHVIDFLQLPYWPIFNIADMGVVFGTITIMALWLIKGVGHDGVLERDREKAGLRTKQGAGDDVPRVEERDR